MIFAIVTLCCSEYMQGVAETCISWKYEHSKFQSGEWVSACYKFQLLGGGTFVSIIECDVGQKRHCVWYIFIKQNLLTVQ
jgi:hypothetical protein